MEHTTSSAITAGSILVEEGTRLPDSLSIERDSPSIGWNSVKDARSKFGEKLEAAGWVFFFMAGEIKATVFGFDKERTMRVALRRLIANVKSQHCNSIEITQVAAHSFLKLPYISVSAHARHIQKGQTFSGHGTPTSTGGSNHDEHSTPIRPHRGEANRRTGIHA